MRRPHPRLIVFVVCGAIDEGRVVIVIVISLPCNRHSRVSVVAHTAPRMVRRRHTHSLSWQHFLRYWHVLRHGLNRAG